MLLFSGESSSSQIGKRVTTILCNLTLRSQFQQYAYSLLITKREINVQVSTTDISHKIIQWNIKIYQIESYHMRFSEKSNGFRKQKNNNEEMEASMN